MRLTPKKRVRLAHLLVGIALAVCLGGTPEPAGALLPTSPRVKSLLNAGLDTLEKVPFIGTNGSQLGSKCLVGLALHKAGRTDSPRIQEAIDACVRQAGEAASYDTTYNQGLAAVFLSEVSPRKNRATLQQYLNLLMSRQMPHGGWGYSNELSGDTSQTQYVALALWHAHQVGLDVPGPKAKKLIDWLNRTQSQEGGWGYKGIVAKGSELSPQNGVTSTLTAAALASLMIGADLHGLLNTGSLAVAGDMHAEGGELPPSVRRVRDRVAVGSKLSPDGVDWGRVVAALKQGEGWIDSMYLGKPSGAYPFYELYAIERFQSFREARQGSFDPEPPWYESGIDYLEGAQSQPGTWNSGCGVPADTAFAVLFMLRATQKSLSRGIGEGAMVSGRGLPQNLASATLKNGQVIVEMDAVGVGEFLAMMERGESDRLDALAADPAALVVGDVSRADAERLAQALKDDDPELRLLAARALGRSGSLDSVPALLYGMTDPDRRVALAARDGLRFLARRPKGYGMPDQFTDDQRYLSIEEWKRWYQRIRPEAIIEFGR